MAEIATKNYDPGDKFYCFITEQDKDTVHEHMDMLGHFELQLQK